MNKIVRVSLVAAVALAALSMSALPASAAGAAVDLTSASQTLRLNENLPVFGINLTSAALVTKLNGVRVDFAQHGSDSDFSFDDLEGSPDGVTLWRDSSHGTAATEDHLDDADTKVSTSFTTSDMRATLAVPGDPLPDAPEGNYTYFLTVRLGAGVSDGDDFTVTLPSDGLQTGTLATSITSVTSNVIAADPDAPTVQSFNQPIGQTDNISWVLSEAVTGVSTSTVAFRLHGTTTGVPAAVSWNVATRTITVDPVSPLRAGERYDALLLPNGPGGIVDKAGNQLAPDTREFRGALDVSETAYGTTYSWRKYSSSSVYGGSYLVNNMAGATATYTFTGRSITWYTMTDPYQGTAYVYIDGYKQPTVNNYSSARKYKVARTYTGLASRTHTIVVRVVGTKSSAARDTRVVVDAFKVGSIYYATPNATYRWATVANSGAAGGSYLAGKFPTNEMSFSFRGTSVSWRTVLGPAMGRATVYIDGVSKGTVDNYSGLTIAKFYRSYGNLADAVHTMRIVISSTKNPGSKDSIVAVDGFIVG